MTALRFPRARVLGTDLSETSLDICTKNAREVGATNLVLLRESVNDATYEGEFDLVICTGVIHYTRDPARALARLARALRPDGVLELLVYNRFHRVLLGAFHGAVRTLARGMGEGDAGVARRLASGLSAGGRLASFVACHRDWQESDSDDLRVNPVEHSFTVESLAAMSEGCGLELVRPRMSQYARFRAETLEWEMPLEDPGLRRAYGALPDVDRWSVTNQLLHERSPMLWFYLRKRGASWERRSEAELARDMLGRSFVRAQTRQRIFLPDKDGVFRLRDGEVDHPSSPPDPTVRNIWEKFDFERPRTMANVLNELGVPTTFESLHLIRLKLTIPAFPYLMAVPSGATSHA